MILYAMYEYWDHCDWGVVLLKLQNYVRTSSA